MDLPDVADLGRFPEVALERGRLEGLRQRMDASEKRREEIRALTGKQNPLAAANDLRARAARREQVDGKPAAEVLAELKACDEELAFLPGEIQRQNERAAAAVRVASTAICETLRPHHGEKVGAIIHALEQLASALEGEERFREAIRDRGIDDHYLPAVNLRIAFRGIGKTNPRDMVVELRRRFSAGPG